MNTERDKFLTEVMGESWHRCDEGAFHCEQCAKNIPMSKDFSTWEGFGKLWEYAIKQDWWDSFVNSTNNGGLCWDSTVFSVIAINPDVFANIVYKFLNNHKA